MLYEVITLHGVDAFCRLIETASFDRHLGFGHEPRRAHPLVALGRMPHPFAVLGIVPQGMRGTRGHQGRHTALRITSYNVCYTKLLR